MDPPNLLLIVTDQHCLEAMGCYGGYADTPRLDALAAEGCRFETAYTACPLCTPARASLLTGHYPHRHGMTCNSDNIQGNVAASLHEMVDRPALLSRQLQQAGYSCRYTGKWHIGTDGGRLFDQTTTAALPRDVGFDGQQFPGHGSGGWHYDAFRQYLKDRGLSYTLRREPGAFYRASIFDGPDEAHVTHYLVDHSIAQIDAALDRGEPFFLWHNDWGPHNPCYAPERFVRRHWDRVTEPWPHFHAADPDSLGWQNLRAANQPEWDRWRRTIPYYLAFASFIDEQVGRLLDHLEQRGIADQTLVLFTADHGEYLGAHGGLHNKGWGNYEQIHRIPMILRPHAGAEAGCERGCVLPHFASLLDVYPTLLDAAGHAYDPQFVHGRSLLDPVRDAGCDWRDDVFVENYGLGHLPITAFTARWGALKYGFNFNGRDELYDLEHDPHELHNRVDDPACGYALRELRERTAAWMERTAYHPHGIREFRSTRLGRLRGH